MPYRISNEKGKNLLTVDDSSNNEAFADGARGLFDALYGLDSLHPEKEIHFTVEGKNETDLFAAWLNHLLEEAANQKMAFCEFDVVSIQKVSPSQYLLTAVVQGEPIDKKRHKVKAEVKKVSAVKGGASKDGKSCTYSCVLS